MEYMLCSSAGWDREDGRLPLQRQAAAHVAWGMVLYGMHTDTRRDVERLVHERRSIRVFTNDPVSPFLVRELLEAATWAPSPHNSQPWRFTVLTRPDDRERLAESMADRLAAELRADGLDDEAIAKQTERSRARIVTAPIAVLCSLAHDGLVEYGDRRRDELEWQMAVQSVGAVLQTLFLLAHERGLGSCWMAAPMYCPDVVRQALDLDPHLAPQALVLMGYPAGPGRVRERRDPEQVVELR